MVSDSDYFHGADIKNSSNYKVKDAGDESMDELSVEEQGGLCAAG